LSKFCADLLKKRRVLNADVWRNPSGELFAISRPQNPEALGILIGGYKKRLSLTH
jgi:hypothetical protein